MSYTGQYGSSQNGHGQYGQPAYGQQQQYGQQGMNTYYPPSQSFSQQPSYQENYGSTDSFVPKKGDRFKASGYPDAWATILWVVNLIGFGAVAAMSYKGLKNTLNGTTPTTGSTGSSIEFNLSGADIAFGISSVVLTGFGLTVVYFLLMQKYILN